MPRILIIDDDVDVRQPLRQMLRLAGYKVVEAADGNEGIGHVRTESIDLIITDIIMPDKEGIETIRELQRDFPSVKIIAISGGGRIAAQHILEAARSFGVTHTLVKPICKKELLLATQALLSGPVVT